MSDDLLDEALLLAISASKGKPVDLETIFDRIDSNQRWVPTYDELAPGVRRAGDAGAIRQVSPGVYVDTRHTSNGGLVEPLTREVYDEALHRYREGFAADVRSVMSSSLMRAMTAGSETAFRVTGGRIGIPPGTVDLDGVSLAFALDLVLEPLGWSCDGAHRDGGLRQIDVIPRDDAKVADRDAVIAATTDVVRDQGLSGRHAVVFPDGEQIEIVPA